MNLEITIKEIAISLAGLKPEEVLGYAEREDGTAVIVSAKGKQVFSRTQLENQAQIMAVIKVANAANNLQQEVNKILEDNKLPVEENTLPKPKDKLPLKHKDVASTATRKPRSKK